MDAVQLVRVALHVLAERVLRVLALVGGGVMAGWSMWGPSWERVVTLAIFSVFAYAVVRTQPEKRDAPVQASTAAQ